MDNPKPEPAAQVANGHADAQAKAIAQITVAKYAKQIVMVLAVLTVTVFACMFFKNPAYLWLLALLLLALG